VKKPKEHQRVLSFLTTLRGAFPDAAIVFTHGACYSLYQILHEVFPSAKPLMTQDQRHIATAIGGKTYDITGEFVDLDGKPKDVLVPLTPRQAEFWSANVAGQRLEYMLDKYRK